MREVLGYLAAFALCAAPLSAQPGPGGRPGMVVLQATVADKDGHFETGLTEDAFRVYEDGVEQRVTAFRRGGVPVSVGLVIDNSESMIARRAEVQATALAFVQESKPADEAFVVNFNDEAFLDAAFTNDISKLREGLARFASRGGAAVWDAVRMSIDYLREGARKHKKVLVLVTDGSDNSSLTSPRDLVKACRDSGASLYTIGLLGEHWRLDAMRTLKVLSEATGGEAFFPRNPAEATRAAQLAVRDIRSEYTITYTPSNEALDGTFRKVDVTVIAPGHLRARTRPGYYATVDGEFRHLPDYTSPTLLCGAPGVSAPEVVSRIDAEYPEKARQLHYVGTVLVSVVVDEDGTPLGVRVEKGADPGLGLGEKAAEAVRQWRFKPARVNDGPVSCLLQAEVAFQPAPVAAEPSLMRYVEATCSARALRDGASGTVVLSAVARRDGLLGDVQVEKGMGLGLDENAARAFAQWRYNPAVKDGSPIDRRVVVDFNFVCGRSPGPPRGRKQRRQSTARNSGTQPVP